MEYNIYVLAVPAKDDTSTPGILATIPVKYVVAAKTNDIPDEIICKMMKEMYRTAAGVQDGV